MRTDKEIEAEITKLQELSNLPNRWNAATKEIIAEQCNTLSERSTHEKVEQALWVDETSEDYKEGDNELWRSVDEAVSWMNGEKGFKAPSEDALMNNPSCSAPDVKEWTVDHLRWRALLDICQEHNELIASERQKREEAEILSRGRMQQIERHQAELVAERQKRKRPER
jgi:hypothetical protein